MSQPVTGYRRHAHDWPLYALLAGLSLLGGFVATKLGAQSATPVLFAALSLGVNCIGHVLIVLYDKGRGRPITLHLRSVLPVTIAIAFIIASNDVNSVLMFAAGAPLSIATPVHGAAVVAISVLVGAWLLRERLNFLQWLGLAACFAGIVLLNV